MTAASVQPTAKTAAPTNSSSMRGFSRPAASSAPVTVPTAIIEASNPYPPASAWKTVTAMVEMKIGKLSPNVPIRKSISRIARKSGRLQT